MKNTINYTIGFLLLCVLGYVAYYSWNMKAKPSVTDNQPVTEEALVEPQIDNVPTVIVDEPATEQPVTEVTDDSMILTMDQKTRLQKPQMILEEGKEYSVTLKTSEGNIAIDLNRKDAPVTVNNFIYLAGLGFYDGLTFHRVINDFMIQGGDPLGNGTGSPGYQFEDEISANNKNARGSIAMANSGPNTNGSQFFINQVDNNYLDSKHTVFGNVTSGLDVVDKIASMENATPVVINKVLISVSSATAE